MTHRFLLAAFTAFGLLGLFTPGALPSGAEIAAAPRLPGVIPCGGADDIPCPNGLTCVDNPLGSCSRSCGQPQCDGICVRLTTERCGGPERITCTARRSCVDDPSDSCDERCGGLHCRGVCVEVAMQTGPCARPEDCAAAEFCSREDGDCEADGYCVERPAVCPKTWEPVCGCDGRTYPTECEEAAAGVSKAADGRCGGACTVDADCARGQACVKQPGHCDGRGACRSRPAVCPAAYRPVCGCDGRTYGNRCQAAADGQNIRARGPCMPPTHE